MENGESAGNETTNHELARMAEMEGRLIAVGRRRGGDGLAKKGEWRMVTPTGDGTTNHEWFIGEERRTNRRASGYWILDSVFFGLAAADLLTPGS
jgi:hypothetical protein